MICQEGSISNFSAIRNLFVNFIADQRAVRHGQENGLEEYMNVKSQKEATFRRIDAA
jgi:hypothetical protein